MPALIVALMVAVLAPTEAASESATRSGLRGLVTLSPTRPVCIEEQPCSKPAPGVLLVFRREAKVVARTTTRSDGTYRVALPPGKYAVFAPEHRRGVGVTPQIVRVLKGCHRHVDLEIDTGIQ